MNILKVFEKRFKRTRRYYKRLKNHFEPEDVHEFRLQIKKLRAVLRLTNASLPEESQMKIEKDLKEFYDITGNIRNLQLHRQRIKFLCKDLFLDMPVSYLEILSGEKDEEIKKTRDLRPLISFAKFRKTIMEALATVPEINIPQFVSAHLDKLNQFLIQPVHSDESLHEVRKILKDILYTRHFIEPSLLPAALADFKYINSFAGKLGNFHDLCVSISFFQKKYMDKITSEHEKKTLIALMQQLELRKAEMKDEIIDELNNLRSKHT